ncbi:CRISPR-associated helicase Cas3' [Streptomyces puniciscabiei]
MWESVDAGAVGQKGCSSGRRVGLDRWVAGVERGGVDVRAGWGKAGGGRVPHPLICHALDTAVVAEGLVDVLVGPHCRAELDRAFSPLGDAVGWMSVLCGVHDLGKLSPTFQGLREDIAAPAMGPAAAAHIGRLTRWRGPGARTDCHHGLLTAVHMTRILKAWGAVPETARTIAWALGGHHGVIPSAASVRQAREAVGDNGGPWWAAACDDLVRQVITLWGLPEPEGLPWHGVRLSTEAVVALAGLTSVSDWIASARPEEDYVGTGVDLAAYLRQARRDEARKIERLAWRPWRPPRETGFRALFPLEERPHPVQEAVETVVGRMRGPGIVVVAAPTGEGKTKAALQATATLVRRFGLRGFYVAMPSRVTSNQAFDAVGQLLAGLGEEAPPVRLLHSAAGEYLKDRKTPVDVADGLRPVGVDVDGEGDGDGEAAEWFAHKRGLLAPLGVGTVDQALMAALRSSHVFVRLTGLSGKVVVFDEVHGYDVHMSTLMDRLLWWLGRLRVPVVLLSATLPARRQHALVESWRAGAAGRPPLKVEAPTAYAGRYPRVAWADTESNAVENVGVEASLLNSDRVVELMRVGFESRAKWAVRHAGAGRCVAVVHNLVRHAVEAHEQIVQRVEQLPLEERPEVFLLHGKLLQAERARVEAAIRAKFGRPDDQQGNSRPRRAIVVGTQLLEEGLDADFDVMISSLAPIDSLIQRMGRIQRHDRGGDRPPLLLALTGVEETPGKIVFPPYTTNVYAEAILLRTWALLRERERLHCPDEVQHLVDLVYGPEELLACPEGWEKQWARADEQLGRGIARKEQSAEAVRLPQPRDDVQLWELTAKATSASRTRQESYRRDDAR